MSADLSAGEHVIGESVGERESLATAYAYWLAVAPRRPATARKYRESLARLARLGFVWTTDVTRERVLEVQRSYLERGASAAYVRAELAALRAIVAQLEEHGRFATGTLAEVRRVAVRPPARGPKRRARHLTRKEADQLAEAAARVAPRIELPIRVAVLAGPRIGELARLRAEDYHDGALWIDTLPEYGEAGSCKTGPRAVPVCRDLAALLAERLPRRGWLFPARRPGEMGRPARTPFLSRWTLEQGIARAREAAGLPDDVTFLVLRHTRASWWLQGSPEQKGASIYKVADWLGHAVTTCETHYGALRSGYDPECESAPAA